MPVLTIHVAAGQHSDAQLETLVVRCSERFAAGLHCPVDRVRVFVTEHRANLYCVGGQPVRDSGARAPYFSFVVLEGRSLEDRQALIAAFTDLIVDILDVPRELVRGGIVPVAPENWGIAGVPASVARQAEIEARRRAAGT